MSVIWQPALGAEAERWRALAEQLTTAHFAPLAQELDRDQRYPTENVAVLVEQRLAGLFIPTRYGGEGATLTATAAVVEAIATGCASTAAILCTYQLGAFPVLLAGREEQKELYLGAMARGVATSFALSERAAGSDAAALSASARRDGEGWRLEGEKYWIGNGGASRYYVVFARTDAHPDAHPHPDADAHHGAGAGRLGISGISAFMVDRDAPGVLIDELADKMGLRGTRTSNLKLGLTVPDSARLGEVGRALRLALATLEVGRILVAAQSLGVALAAYRDAAGRAVARETFGRPIIDNQAIGFRLADVAVEISAARMMLYEAAKAYDAGQNVSTLGAMAKLYASEVAHRAVDAAVQVWGGLGYCKPSLAERLYRDQRVLEIYEGSSEIQRLVLARTVRKEAEAAGCSG
ncbi:MAG: acyl-CoA dehydrogenase family protein [Xanthobacteraceae bacterium]